MLYDQHKLLEGLVVNVVSLVMKHFGTWGEGRKNWRLKQGDLLLQNFRLLEENSFLYNFTEMQHPSHFEETEHVLYWVREAYIPMNTSSSSGRNV